MADETTTSGETPETPAIESFDGWLAAQPDNIKTLAAQHVAGLKSALDAERKQRKEDARQLRDALAKAEKGSDTEKVLGEMSGKLEAATRRAEFYEQATRPEVNCTNVRAAWLVAQAEDLFTKTGDPDWKRIRDEAPELFQRKTATANAGAGTQTPAKTGPTMNEYIRRAAGRA